MYKKILSLALALMIMGSCLCISVSAVPSQESVFKEAFIRYSEQQGTASDEEYLHIRRMGSAGKYDVYRAYYEPCTEATSKQIIGDYVFYLNVTVGDEAANPTGLYAFNGVELIPLKEAYDKGLVDLDKLYAEASDDEEFVPLSENEKLKIKCKTAYIEEYGITGEMAEYSWVTFAVQYENYAVFRVYPHMVLPMESFQYLDGYLFWEGNIIGSEDNNPTGLYTLDNYGNVEALSATVYKSFIDLDELYPTLSEVAPMYISGDIDSDGKLTVKDATLIQKYLAKVPEAVKTVYEHRLGYCVMEVDEPWELKMFGGSFKVTVKDATYIQKKVAKMIKEEESTLFADDAISIYLEQDEVKEYTVADFPEFEAEKVERWDSGVLELTILTVYLKNPGKSNVINAVNSLKYREGAEFDSVDACYKGFDA